MSLLTEKSIKDPSWREWVMPQFSTSTATDRTVCSVVLMGALKNYFQYTFFVVCGIPSVTLLGEKPDWELLREKLSRIPSLGEEPALWTRQLEQVVTGMCNTFDDDQASQCRNFWQKIAHYHKMGSGDPRYSGWITAFCFWDNQGRPLYKTKAARDLDLGGALFHPVKTRDIPTALVEVPVKVISLNREYHTCILAGSLAFRGSNSSDSVSTQSDDIDTVQPVSTWLIYEKKDANQGRVKLD